MEELILNYSLSEIAMYTVTLALAIKGAVNFYDWAVKKIRGTFDKEYAEKQKQEKTDENIADLQKFYAEKKIVDDGFAHLKDVDTQILEKLAAIEAALEEHIRTEDNRNADAARAYILRFNMELYRNLKHTDEDFGEVLKRIDEYEKYCRSHPDYENSRAVLAIENIRRSYSERQKKHDFA